MGTADCDPMTPEELAASIRVDISTVYCGLQEGDVPGAYKFRGQWRIPVSALAAIKGQS